MQILLKNRVFCLFFLLFIIQISAQNEEKIQQVTIDATTKKFKSKKENPAYAIMQEVWKHKKSNGLDKFNTYQFDEYEKIEMDLDNIDSAFTKKKIFNQLDFIFKYGDTTNGKITLPMFLNESFYKNYGENNPDKKVKRKLIANKTAGFQNNEVMSMTAKNLYKDINIYDPTINYFNIGFPGPLSEDGFSTYNYNLEDTVTVRKEKCYLIKYEPRREEVLALRGNLYISVKNYAVVKASLRSTKKLNVNFVNSIYTELEFDNPDENTFLPVRNYTELGLSLLSKKKDAKSLLAKRTVDYSQYVFNQNIDPQIFSNKEADDNMVKQPDEFWDKVRTDSLSKSEKGVYTMLDEMQKVPKFKTMVKLYETLDSGYYNVGHAIDLGDIYSVVGFNDVEGTRIRIGARTYFSANDMWRAAGYLAYGFKDNQVKYGAEYRYMFNKNNRFTLGVGTRRDVMQLGVQLTNDEGIMTRSFASSSVFSSGNNTSLSSVNQTGVFASIEPFKNFQVRLDGTMQSIKSADEDKFNLMYYRQNELRKTVIDSHVTLSLLARPGAKYSQNGVDRYQFTTLGPTFLLKYTHGIEGLFNADFNYNKLQFLYSQPIITGSWGRSIINFEAGKNFNTVPLALQNIIPGNQSYSIMPNTFALLNYYEFVADQYATLHYEHHFNGKILSFIPLIKKLKFRELVFFRTAVGSLSDESKNINVENTLYSAPSSKPYYEYGFGIENIGFGNLKILRVDFNWRGNYLENPDARRFGVKFGFQFNF